MAVTQLTEEIVLAALGTVKDPELHRGMIELKMIQDVALVDPRTVAMRVVLTAGLPPEEQDPRRYRRRPRHAARGAQGRDQVGRSGLPHRFDPADAADRGCQE